ncbi:MAG: hypothetical protein OXU20_19400 [Myxococcales bacterium]|nr:hypothetical protein [Myxococcales bacterium]
MAKWDHIRDKHNLTDGEAKEILRGWPTRTSMLWASLHDGGYWIQAQPKEGQATTPTLRLPGTEVFKTQPDGLWFYIVPDSFVDAVAVEVSGSRQNLYDKRSRYMPTVGSVIACLPRAWLTEAVGIAGGAARPRWRACGTFAEAPTYDHVLPVRFLRVAFCIPDYLYREWKGNHVPAGHEYYCPHSMLTKYNNQAVQGFLKRMTLPDHYF